MSCPVLLLSPKTHRPALHDCGEQHSSQTKKPSEVVNVLVKELVAHCMFGVRELKEDTRIVMSGKWEAETLHQTCHVLLSREEMYSIEQPWNRAGGRWVYKPHSSVVVLISITMQQSSHPEFTEEQEHVSESTQHQRPCVWAIGESKTSNAKTMGSASGGDIRHIAQDFENDGAQGCLLC